MQKQKEADRVQKLLKSKFRGKSKIKGKVAPRYPMQAERECIRKVRRYIRKIRAKL